MKASFLGKLLERADRLGPEELQTYLVRLAREKGFLETVFNTLQEGVVVLDEKGRMEYWNRSACRLLSIPEDGPPHTPLGRYLRGLSWEELVKSGEISTRKIEIDYPEYRVLRFYLLPVEEATSGRLHVVIFHDVTREESAVRKTMETERLQALTLLAAGVAHELGNPLNSLNIHLQLMQRDLRGMPSETAERLRDSIQVAQKEIGRLDAIVTQFLKAVRPTRPQLQPADIHAVLRETMELMRHELKDRDIIVEEELAANLPTVLADAEQIKQVFYNLIKNAAQSMTKHGILRIHTEKTSDWLIISFADNGSGISVEDLPRVFEPYFTTKENGSGLGLIIVQRIVREHGGELELESNRGRGTTMRIKLPLGEKRVHLLGN